MSSGSRDGAPSSARPHKAPAKAIHARHRAALSTGGGRLPAALRKRFAAEPLPRRAKPASASTRAGKRTPRTVKRGEGR